MCKRIEYIQKDQNGNIDVGVIWTKSDVKVKVMADHLNAVIGALQRETTVIIGEQNVSDSDYNQKLSRYEYYLVISECDEIVRSIKIDWSNGRDSDFLDVLLMSHEHAIVVSCVEIARLGYGYKQINQ